MRFPNLLLNLQANSKGPVTMNGFKNLEIKNFRGIDHLKIDDFSRVNVLLGQNGSGKGMFRNLTIVAASDNPISNIVLLDEIENGLYYSAYKKLWQAIFALATSTDKQLFVTTRSKETLGYLNEMLEENPAYQQELRLYTLEKTKVKGFQAYKYTYEGLSGACENDIEIRSIVNN